MACENYSPSPRAIPTPTPILPVRIELSMSNPDSSLNELVKKIREAGGEVEHPDLSTRYIAYLASLLQANSLLDDDFQHLLHLYAQLHSGDYLNKSRTSTSPSLITGLQKLVATKVNDSLPALVGKHSYATRSLRRCSFDLLKPVTSLSTCVWGPTACNTQT